MEDSGRLTEEQAMQHPKRNEINKALGFTGNISVQDDYAETGHSPFLPGDLILLCSDGLSDMVNKQGITGILLKEIPLVQKGTELIEAANANGGRDNITVVLVRNNNESFVHEATKPVSLPENKQTPPFVTERATPTPAGENRVQEQTPTHQGLQRQTKSKGLNPLLVVIVFVVLASIAYFAWKNWYTGTLEQKHQVPDATLNAKNAQALKLQDTLDKLKGNILILDSASFSSPIVITEPIRINRDSLYLKASSNITIKSDSGYNGQPFLIAPENKSTLLENFTLENFDDVSSLQKKGVLLKDVQFIKRNIRE